MFGSFSHDFESLPLQRLFRTHTELKFFLLTTPYLGEVPQASPKPMGSARHNSKTVSALSSDSTNKPLSIFRLHKTRSLFAVFWLTRSRLVIIQLRDVVDLVGGYSTCFQLRKAARKVTDENEALKTYTASRPK